MRLKMTALLATLILAARLNAQLPPGSLVVYRVGTGSAALTNAATATFVDVFNTTGTGQTASSTVTITSSGAGRLTNSGTATSEGALTRSTNGLLLTFGGYDGNAGTAGIAATTAAANPRVIGQIDASATYSLVGNLAGNFSGNNIRGAAVDGGNYWATGASTGVVSLVSGTASLVSSTTTNNRVVNIQSNQLYFSTGSGATRGIYAVGAGTPTTGPVTSTNVINTGGASSPYAFQAATSGTTVYIADDTNGATGGIQKWTFNGSTWANTYTLGTGVVNIGARGLTVDWSGANAVIYATTSEGSGSNRLIKITDTGAGSAVTTLATSATNTAFRGVEQTILPAVWTSSTAGTVNWTASNTSTSGFSNAFSNWSVGLANGINLSFQNTNSGASPLAITANNNTTLTSVSSITFANTGSGGSGGTQYTLTGNALTLTGNASTGSGVTNNTTSNQTINLNLTLAAAQTFNANTGNLTFGGTVALGSGVNNFTLTVTGANNTVLGNAVTNGGSGASAISKTGLGTLTLLGASTYSGGTTISGGKVLANNSSGSATGSGAVTVAANATLGGGNAAGTTGFITGPVTVNGTIAPGNSTGILNVGATTINPAGAYAWEVSSTTNNALTAMSDTGGSGTTGVDNDLLNVGGALSFNANSTFSIRSIDNITGAAAALAGFSNTNSYSWLVATYSSIAGLSNVTIDDSLFVAQNGSLGGVNFQLNAVAGNLYLNFSPVPEPAAIFGMSAAAVALACFYVRRGKSRRASPATAI